MLAEDDAAEGRPPLTSSAMMHGERSHTLRKPILVVAVIVPLLLVGCDPGSDEPAATPVQETPEPTSHPTEEAVREPIEDAESGPAIASPVSGVTLWGGTAHIEVAASESCSDLQSWFDDADAQRAWYLERFGPEDPNLEYAFAVMGQADDRMSAIGCYD